MQSANRLAQYLAGELGLDDRKADALRFGAEVIFSTALGLAAIAVTGYLLGCPAEALAAAGACAVIRSFAGGAHCSTAWRCAVTSGAAFSSLGKAANMLPFHPGGWESYGIILAVSTVSVYLIVKLAPVDSPVNPIKEPARRVRLKRHSLYAALVVTLVLFLALSFHAPQGIVLATGFGLGWSGLILTAPIHDLMVLADRAMGFCGKWLRMSASQSA